MKAPGVPAPPDRFPVVGANVMVSVPDAGMNPTIIATQLSEPLRLGANIVFASAATNCVPPATVKLVEAVACSAGVENFGACVKVSLLLYAAAPTINSFVDNGRPDVTKGVEEVPVAAALTAISSACDVAAPST